MLAAAIIGGVLCCYLIGLASPWEALWQPQRNLTPGSHGGMLPDHGPIPTWQHSNDDTPSGATCS